jgi:hypothetical protein
MATVKQNGFVVTITGFVEIPQGDLAAYGKACLTLDAVQKGQKLTPELIETMKLEGVEITPRVRRVEAPEKAPEIKHENPPENVASLEKGTKTKAA